MAWNTVPDKTLSKWDLHPDSHFLSKMMCTTLHLAQWKKTLEKLVFIPHTYSLKFGFLKPRHVRQSQLSIAFWVIKLSCRCAPVKLKEDLCVPMCCAVWARPEARMYSKARLDVALGSLVEWLATLHIAGGLKLDHHYGPFQPKRFHDFMTARFPTMLIALPLPPAPSLTACPAPNTSTSQRCSVVLAKRPHHPCQAGAAHLELQKSLPKSLF